MGSNLQSLLVTSGFPRSGNTFVNYAFYKLFNLEFVHSPQHSVLAIKKRKHTFVPFRHPLECVSSWHLYQDEFTLGSSTLEDDLNFYLRFYTSLEPLYNTITLLDFDLFKDDLSYLSSKVTGLYDVTLSSTTLEEVKAFMNDSDRGKHLPRNPQEQRQEIQEQILATDLYQDCLGVYTQLKAITAS
jgi:hypothetical protein